MRIFSDTASGALDERPKLTEALDHVRAGDTSPYRDDEAFPPDVTHNPGETLRSSR